MYILIIYNNKQKIHRNPHSQFNILRKLEKLYYNNSYLEIVKI